MAKAKKVKKDKEKDETTKDEKPERTLMDGYPKVVSPEFGIRVLLYSDRTFVVYVGKKRAGKYTQAESKEKPADDIEDK